jgi:phosphoribosyl-AMP cyclohydrolase
MLEIDAIKWNKQTGLIPVVVQDYINKDVLMQAYVNKEALNKTIDTGYAHYFSRSRNRLWMKGETSGNVQRIIEIAIDCDEDALLYIVEQKGVACHTGNRSCFYRKIWRIDV